MGREVGISVMHSSSEGLPRSNMTPHLDDARRLVAAQQGDDAALEWVFRTYQRPVYTLCHRLLSRADDAEDATQATFVGAFRALSRFRGQSSLKTWLYRIAVTESLSILRRRRSLPDVLQDDVPVGDGAAAIIERTAVQAVMRAMRPEQRLVLVLFYWEDLSCEEISAVLGVSLSGAKMRLKRARDEFERQYGGDL